MKKHFALILSGLLASQLALAAHFEIDPDHSSISFKIRHMLSKVEGRFTQYKGSFDTDTKAKTGKASVTIETASIDTGVKKRDDHLRSPDFFDAAKYPTITFESTGVSNVSGKSAKLKGNLTMHGVTKPVTIDLQIGGEGKDPWGGTRAGFEGKTKLNRKDFGLTWNKTLESGGLLVGEDVEIDLNIEGLSK